MLSRIVLACLPLLTLLAGCSSSEKAVSKKEASAEGVSENETPKTVVPDTASPVKSLQSRHMLWQVSDSNSSV